MSERARYAPPFLTVTLTIPAVVGNGRTRMGLGQGSKKLMIGGGVMGVDQST